MIISSSHRKLLVAALAVALVLILIVGSGGMSGSTMNGLMSSQGRIGGYTLMWVPTLLAVGVGVLLGWLLFGRRR